MLLQDNLGLGDGNTPSGGIGTLVPLHPENE